jgi:hypothetical protein
MKTIFEVNNEIFGRGVNLLECYAYYEEKYKPLGFLLDKENETVYFIIDKELNFNEGDRIELFFTRVITWKCTDVINNVITYLLDEE